MNLHNVSVTAGLHAAPLLLLPHKPTRSLRPACTLLLCSCSLINLHDVSVTSCVTWFTHCQWFGFHVINSPSRFHVVTFLLCLTPRLQARYGKTWSSYSGGSYGDIEEIFLHPDEHIIQLVFVTNKGREFPFGKDYGGSFNAVPLYPNTVLRYFSGSSGSVIDAIAFHWHYLSSSCTHC
uniref:Jacalin-type lectin domain-containing protein n=1 Tax=Leptobrachium leishanense TaxID=445787 RepID=A0A8C5QJ68_9ANUR